MKIMGIDISKTIILGWFMTIAGFTGLFGLDFNMEAIGLAFVNAWDAGAELYGLIIGPIIIWLRMITTSPLAGGILASLMGKK